MVNHFDLLDISSDATKDQIDIAYTKKKGEIIATEENGEKRQELLEELDVAYQGVTKKTALAVTGEPQTQREIDPALEFLDTLVHPLHNDPDVTATIPCIFCGSPNPASATICTECGKQISRRCPNCGKLLRVDREVCTRCNTIILEYNQDRLRTVKNTEETISRERAESEIRVDSLEARHRKRALYGFVFWSVVVLVGIGLLYLAYRQLTG